MEIRGRKDECGKGEVKAQRERRLFEPMERWKKGKSVNKGERKDEVEVVEEVEVEEKVE